jgi:hypothetical protein
VIALPQVLANENLDATTYALTNPSGLPRLQPILVRPISRDLPRIATPHDSQTAEFTALEIDKLTLQLTLLAEYRKAATTWPQASPIRSAPLGSFSAHGNATFSIKIPYDGQKTPLGHGALTDNLSEARPCNGPSVSRRPSTKVLQETQRTDEYVPLIC